MATQADVRKIALALPGAIEGRDGFGFSVKDTKGKERGFVWSWKERIDPKKSRVPSKTVIALRVDGLDAKEALLAIDPDKIFTEPHYNGYPAVLVRLAAVTMPELRQLVTEAHRCMMASGVSKSRRSKGAALGSKRKALGSKRAPTGTGRPSRRRRSRS